MLIGWWPDDAPRGMPGLPGDLFPGDRHRPPGLLSEVRIGSAHVEAGMIVRTTDPWTSHAGAAEVTASGRRRTQAELCLDVVLTTPGLTAGEIGQRTGLGHVPAQRRLSDLRSAGKVTKGTARQYSGRPQVTWWPSERQGNLL